MITNLWYSVHNGGDGSAYPILLESEALAELDQEHHNKDDGWAEDCSGCFTVKSDSPISIMDNIETVGSQIAEIEENLAADYMQEYKRTNQYPEMFARLENKLEALKTLRAADD